MLIRHTAILTLVLQAGAVQAGDLALSACNKVRHGPEALRYEMQGTTTLKLTLNPAGRPIHGTVTRSSGWKTLDADALRLARSCRYAEGETGTTLDIPWVLPPGAAVHTAPQAIAGSCQSSQAFKVAPAGPDSVKIRLLVWNDGQVYAPRIETGSGDALTDYLARDFAHSCRFTPAIRDGKAATGTALLYIAYDAALLKTMRERLEQKEIQDDE